MIAPPDPQAASQNLVYTYLELGGATNGSRIWREPGFCACTGPFEHPVCNFATDLTLDRSTVSRLVELARTRTCFSVYSLPGVDQDRQNDILERAGFHLNHTLVQMVATGPSEAESLGMAEARDPDERKRVATFMVEQFFSRQVYRYRRGIVEATTGANNLRLLRLERENRVEAAVMLCEHGDTVGIYNLCVDARLRGRGLGSKLVREVGHWAARRGLGVTLQCSPQLVTWYSSLGYEDSGEVTVYGLCRLRDVDIMGP